MTESAGDARPVKAGVADCARLRGLRKWFGGAIARDLSPLRGGLNISRGYDQLRRRIRDAVVKNNGRMVLFVVEKRACKQSRVMGQCERFSDARHGLIGYKHLASTTLRIVIMSRSSRISFIMWMDCFEITVSPPTNSDRHSSPKLHLHVLITTPITHDNRFFKSG